MRFLFLIRARKLARILLPESGFVSFEEKARCVFSAGGACTLSGNKTLVPAALRGFLLYPHTRFGAKSVCGYTVFMNDIERDALKLLERNRVGALLRVYSYTPEAVWARVASAMEALRRLLTLKTGDRQTFNRIDFLVSSDPNFEDSDCGLTAERLREMVRSEFPDAPVNIYEIKRGDIYCMLLNYGIANQLEDRIAYSMILSHGASSYATAENVNGLLAAMYNKARVAGVAMNELAELVHKGYIMDTFAIWHNKSLMTVGGFDLLAAKPSLQHAEKRDKVKGWSEMKAARHGDGAVEYHAAGCEEIIPLTRLVKYFGKCIAVIEPKGEGMMWKEDDLNIDPRAYHRHLAKLATKEERQRRMAATQGVDLEFIQRGLMDTRIDESPTLL